VDESISWSRRLQLVAEWALIGAGGLVVGLVAIFFSVSFVWMIVVLVRLLGAELGLWEWDWEWGLSIG
jgi:hypothetical protein